MLKNYEILQEMEDFSFEWTQGSICINPRQNSTLTTVYEAINRLSQIEWFKKSLLDIRAFKSKIGRTSPK